MHDSVSELIMTTILQDRKAFGMEDYALSREELKEIKNTIEASKPTQADLDNFINSVVAKE